MSNFTVEQKSQLAKLMATENVTIQHQKISTARFDLKNRTIYLPIWSEMSGPLYDLLFGHEVGHALETPYEGLHDVMTNLPEGKGRGYKSFLNIVEDARIEKRIQRRYPGLRLSFKKGYADLMARDFFGTKGRDINTFPFIDRLNLFTKSQYTLDVEFTDREQEMVEKVKKLESWEDTVCVTDEIYEYAKNEEPETNFGDSFADGDDSYEDGFGEEGGNFGDDTDFEDTETDGSGDDADGGEDSNSDSDEDENGQDSDSKADGGDASDDDEEKSEAGAKGEKSDESSDETDEDGELGEYNRYKESGESDSNSDGPRSITDENFRANEGLLVDATSFDYDYVSLPTPNLDAIVTPAKRVQEQMTNFYKIRSSENYGLTEEDIKNALTEFKRKNDRYISLLAKEFEMKKAAKSYSKRKVSDTGDIDINKLASYRVNDNIFKRMTKIPKGKSHGLVLLLDYSGSMQENMAGSIEQILVLTAFCRKVNIPFVVYSFGNSTAAVRADFGGDSEKVNRHCFSRNVGEFSFGQVRLREYLNSNMSTAEYNNAIKNMICLGKSFEGTNRYYNNFGRPESECLSNTPTIEALVALQPIVKKFRERNNLDITNLVVVQDGDADYVNQKLDLGYADNVYAVNILSDKKRANVILQDTKNKFTKNLFKANQRVDYRDYTRTMFAAIVEWFTLTTNSKAFGFYMVPGGPSRIRNAVIEQYRDKNGTYLTDKYNGTNRWEMIRAEAYEIAKAVKRDRFLDANKEGYSGFYLIPGGKDLMTEDDELVVEGKVTAGKLKTAFMKMNEKKQTNRVLVSRFIDGIAA
jgi:hypothetical protein